MSRRSSRCRSSKVGPPTSDGRVHLAPLGMVSDSFAQRFKILDDAPAQLEERLRNFRGLVVSGNQQGRHTNRADWNYLTKVGILEPAGKVDIFNLFIHVELNKFVVRIEGGNPRQGLAAHADDRVDRVAERADGLCWP